MFINARQGEVAAAGAPKGESSGAGAKTEQPVCEQAVAFTLSGLQVWSCSATLNGRPVPYLRVNHAFKGIVIPAAGEWTLECAHRPVHWNLSLGVAAFGAVMLTGIGVWPVMELQRSSRREATSPERRSGAYLSHVWLEASGTLSSLVVRPARRRNSHPNCESPDRKAPLAARAHAFA